MLSRQAGALSQRLGSCAEKAGRLFGLGSHGRKLPLRLFFPGAAKYNPALDLRITHASFRIHWVLCRESGLGWTCEWGRARAFVSSCSCSLLVLNASSRLVQLKALRLNTPRVKFEIGRDPRTQIRSELSWALGLSLISICSNCRCTFADRADPVLAVARELGASARTPRARVSVIT